MAMTDQEMFDAVVAHCVEQGEPAFEGKSCYYRMADGRKCAIGCLIPDRLYDIEMEGKAAIDVIETFHLQHIIPNIDLAEDLQDAHDVVMSNWLGHCLQSLIEIARRHGLSQATAQAALSKLEQS